ncbi:MAG: hypothetical protein Q9P01_20950 [Anaerolineae bacterium]|nr:hypothetical protein [Anaerolineae bacterium]MDQ7037216.1 hypothetical protein [Anaerolineae bacterium]
MPPALADTLAQLADLQQLVIAPDLGHILETLKTPLAQYTELEFRSDAKRIDLITLSDNPTDIQTFIKLLSERGTSDEAIAVATRLAQFGMGKVMGMKIPVTGLPQGGEIYIRGALMLLNEVRYLLKAYDISDTALDKIQEFATVFDKNHTHILAADVTMPPRFTVFFTTYLEPDKNHDDHNLVQQALEVIGIPQTSFFPIHDLLSISRPNTFYFSWQVGQDTQRVKLDYRDVRLGLLAEAVRAAGAPEQVDVLTQWGTTLKLFEANYAGIILAETGIVSARGYFTLR